MAGFAETNDLVGEIYDAALEPNGWQNILESMTARFNSNMAYLGFRECSDGKSGTLTSRVFGMTPDILDNFNLHYRESSPTFRHSRDLSVGDIYADQMLDDYDAYRRSAVYNEYFRPLNAEHMLKIKISGDKNGYGGLIIRRSARSGFYSGEDIALLAALTPHLRRAFAFCRRLSELDLRLAAAGDALDALPLGIVLISNGGDPMYVNRAGARMFSVCDGLTADATGVHSRHRHDDHLLQSLIAGATAPNQENGLSNGHSYGGSMTLQRPSGKRPYAVTVTPVSRHEALFARFRPSAVIFISDPEVESETPTEILRRLYGLTAAEAELAVRLANGLSLDQAADQQDIAKETARAHLKRIFSKTETGRQAQLVRLLMTTPPAGQVNSTDLN